jgi:two-component system LytT family sensor kinase
MWTVFIENITKDGYGRIIRHLSLWLTGWFYLRYSFISGIVQDNYFISTHASIVVFCQTMGTFYFLSYVIFPSFLYKQRFLVVLLILILLFTIAHIINYYEVSYLLPYSDGNWEVKPSYLQRLWTGYFKPNGPLGIYKSKDICQFTFAFSFFVVSIMLLFKVVKDTLTSQATGLNLKMDKLKLENEKLQLEKDYLNLERKGFKLERDNLSLELNFLKSQINPHFLFNILNSIYMRTVDVSEEASDLVLKLSDLMRYSLYSGTEDKVGLVDEIAYIQNYMDLESYRHSKNLVSISFEMFGELEGLTIAPLLLISFVENAFKFGINQSRKKSFVHVLVKVEDHRLEFIIENSVFEIENKPKKNDIVLASGGIGISNTKKRLDLLYPGKHNLNIYRSLSVYHLSLLIHLD